MRKTKVLAIIALALGIAAFHSCKKDDELTKDNGTRTETSAFNPNGINDMNAYLSDFIKNMKSPTKNSSSLPLEDAEWHLTACLNYKMCNANADRRDMIYDTIITKIHVDGNMISMADINSSFVEISKNVSELYNSYNMEGKRIVYIYSTINSDNTSKGDTDVRTIMATGNKNTHYYFNDWEFICLDTLFTDNAQYHWVTASDTLERYVKEFGIQYPSEEFYYVPTSEKVYHFRDYSTSDIVGGVAYGSRLFYRSGISAEANPPYLSELDMMFYLDSYLGLVMNERSMRGSLIDVWVINGKESSRDIPTGDIVYHDLKGKWGFIVEINEGENDNPPLN